MAEHLLLRLYPHFITPSNHLFIPLLPFREHHNLLNIHPPDTDSLPSQSCYEPIIKGLFSIPASLTSSFFFSFKSELFISFRQNRQEADRRAGGPRCNQGRQRIAKPVWPWLAHQIRLTRGTQSVITHRSLGYP